jgi:effector-binding domain-containing protein
MNTLKKIGYVLLALFVIIMVLPLFAPTDVVVTRSVTIESPAKFVWNNVNTLEAMDRWSPWNELDPEMTKTFKGEPGSIGSVSRWEGNDDVGTGEQEIKEIEEELKITTELRFIKPIEETNKAIVMLEETDGKVKATWQLEAHSDYPMNVFNLFIDMEKMIGTDFEKGLGYLKTIVETELWSATYSGFEINAVDAEETYYINTHDTVIWSEMEQYFPNNIPQVYGAVMQAGGPDAIIGMPRGFYFYWDDENERTDMGVGVQVASSDMALEGYETKTVAAGKTLVLDYYGSYNGTEKAHYAMDDFMTDRGLEMRDMVIEEYVTDPMTVENESEILTRITYYIK